jgi:hypothetical protein
MEGNRTQTDIQEQAVLDYLELNPKDAPDLPFLEELIGAYTRFVPWESATRIVRRARVNDDEMCPRWPNIFWEDAIEKGGGGTCFESNYAFYALLTKLGFTGYLTINNMGHSIGCHAAIIVQIDNDFWLTDVGLPVYIPLALHPGKKTVRTSRFHRYTATTKAPNVYDIDRDRHPNRNCYTLINTPVAAEQFRKAIVDDYGQNGLFLDRVIVSKVIGDHVWRFNSGEVPYQLERFKDGQKEVIDLPKDLRGAAQSVGRRFGIEEQIIFSGLEISTAR